MNCTPAPPHPIDRTLPSSDLYEIIGCDQFGNDCEMPAAVDMMIRVSHLLVCFNSSANFVVYYLNGEKFRDDGFPRMGAREGPVYKKLSERKGKGKRKM